MVEVNGCFVRGSDDTTLGKSALKLSVPVNVVRSEGCVVILEDPVKQGMHVGVRRHQEGRRQNDSGWEWWRGIVGREERGLKIWGCGVGAIAELQEKCGVVLVAFCTFVACQREFLRSVRVGPERTTP